MCLAVIRWQPDASIPLKGVANRDEFRARPTAALAHWAEPPILAGRDLEAGGTWLGFAAGGRFALLTNLRSGPPERGLRSRGELVVRYLREQCDPLAFCTDLAHTIAEYAGFNLLLGAPGTLVYWGTQRPEARVLAPGIHALSNAPLGTPWPKCRLAEEQMRAQHQRMEQVLDDHGILASQALADAGPLPDTGIEAALERRLSAQTICGAKYGTRSRSHWVMGADGKVRVLEQQLDAAGEVVDRLELGIS